MSNPKRTQAEFIFDQVIRTGYPLEMEISSLLEEDDWIVFNNDFYLVEDETGKRIDKEIDMHAMYPPRLTFCCISSMKPSSTFRGRDKFSLQSPYLQSSQVQSRNRPPFITHPRRASTKRAECEYPRKPRNQRGCSGDLKRSA
ncbi:hypothetical protein ES703_41660 [subsurface metagenome]